MIDWMQSEAFDFLRFAVDDTDHSATARRTLTAHRGFPQAHPGAGLRLL